MKIFVYPGSFDPITNGHLDIINRGAQLCDKLIVAVLQNTAKNTTGSGKDSRIALIEKCIRDIPNVEVKTFDGLLVDFVAETGSSVVIRGLRAISDFDYELQMAFLNRQMNENIDTCFLMASQKYSFLSSSIVRDVALYRGPIKDFVPECIVEDVYKIYSKS